MSQKALRITRTALVLAAALALIPLPAHAAKAATEPVRLWTLAWQWLESLVDSRLDKSGSAIDPDGKPLPGGGSGSTSQTGGDSGSAIDSNGGKTGG